MNHFLNQNKIQCYKITLETGKLMYDTPYHANNLIYINNKIYITDVTWGIYYKDISTLSDKKINYYKSIKDLSYIINIEGHKPELVMNYYNKKRDL